MRPQGHCFEGCSSGLSDEIRGPKMVHLELQNCHRPSIFYHLFRDHGQHQEIWGVVGRCRIFKPEKEVSPKSMCFEIIQTQQTRKGTLERRQEINLWHFATCPGKSTKIPERKTSCSTSSMFSELRSAKVLSFSATSSSRGAIE